MDNADQARKAELGERIIQLQEAKMQVESNTIRDREIRKDENVVLSSNFPQLFAQTQLSHSQYTPQQAMSQLIVSSSHNMNQTMNNQHALLITTENQDEIAITNHGNESESKRSRGEAVTMEAEHQKQVGIHQSNGDRRR